MTYREKRGALPDSFNSPAADLTLMLHIGPGKTGSSAIQAWLECNAEKLVQHGIYYPAKVVQQDLFTGNGQNLAALLLRPLPSSDDALLADIAILLDPYVNFAKHKNCQTILLSSEAFADVPKENLEAFSRCLRGRFGVVVIGFIRDPYWWIWSVWIQTVKRSGQSEPFASFAQRNHKYYMDKLTFLSSLFTDVRLLIYRSKNLIQDFASVSGVPDYLIDKRSESIVNRSLSKNETEALLELNSVFKNAELSRMISDRMILLNKNVEPYRYFEPRLAELIRNSNEQYINKLRHRIANPEVALLDQTKYINKSADNQPQNNTGPDEFDYKIILEEIKKWHDKNSSYMTLQNIVRQPRSEKERSHKLPQGFNPIEYLLLNPDVLGAGVDPIDHYLSFGRFEGRVYCRA